MKKSRITTKVIGFTVVETNEVNVELNEADEKAFASNPEEVIERLLKESGQVVNRVSILKPSTLPKNARARDHWFHIVYPDNERSGWICA